MQDASISAMVSATDDVRGPVKVLHVLITNRSLDHVLVRVLPDRVLQLPSVEVPAADLSQKRSASSKIGALATLIGNRLGADVHNFRVVWVVPGIESSNKGGVQEHQVLGMNLCDESATVIESLKWISRDVASKCEWSEPCEHEGAVGIKDEITKILEEMKEEGLPWERDMLQSWGAVGWYYIATSWIDDVLKANDMVRESRIRETYRTPTSLVMTCKVKNRMDRDAGRCQQSSGEVLHIKTVCPVFREGQRTAAIARIVGDVAPEVIAVHERGGMMIQRDGGYIMDEAFDQEALLKTVTEMQRTSMGCVDELEAEGLMVMDSEWLACNIQSILNHEAFNDKHMVYGYDGVLDEWFKEALEELRTEAGQLQKSFRKLASLGLPDTLVHGDLGLHNVGSRKKRGGELYCFFDWAQSFVGHPLYDFVHILDHIIVPGHPAMPQVVINYETALPQISKLWMPSATRDEIESILGVTRMMRDVIEIHYLTQQYDALEHKCRYHAISELKRVVFAMLDTYGELRGGKGR